MSTMDVPTRGGSLLSRAEAGAAFLDERLPAWFVLVNPKTLDIGRGNRCVLGQLGRFVKHEECDRNALYLAVADTFGLDAVRLLRLGFNAESLDDIVPLTVAWIAVINLRRRLGPVAGLPVADVHVVPAVAAVSVVA